MFMHYKNAGTAMVVHPRGAAIVEREYARHAGAKDIIRRHARRHRTQWLWLCSICCALRTKTPNTFEDQ